LVRKFLVHGEPKSVLPQVPSQHRWASIQFADRIEGELSEHVWIMDWFEDRT
jgi:hypothetical protein